MALTAFDHDMIHHAKNRGIVLVNVNGRPVPAILHSWRKQRHGCHTRQCRIEFGSGRFRTVDMTDISLPEGIIHE